MPSPTSGVRCPNDTRLLKTNGVTEYPSGDIDTAGAVNLISQDKSTVTVELVQAWDGPIEKLFYAYKVDIFQKTCKEEDGVQIGTTIHTITLQCKAMVPVAHLTICLQDMNGNLLDAGDKASVSKCCHSDAPEGTPAVCYDLEIACETTCGSGSESVNQRRRNLRSK